jgi:ribonucleoside-diphosphate reductase alpha chain
MAMLRIRYGSPASLAFIEQVTKELAMVGWQAALDLAREKGPAPIMNELFEVTKEMLAQRPEMAKDGHKAGDKLKGSVLHARYSRYMQRIASEDPDLAAQLAEVGARFTHHSSIAPTGTISLTFGNNASNGIEPSFSHRYLRNIIVHGKKSKQQSEVLSYEFLAYKTLIDPTADADKPLSEAVDAPAGRLPGYFVTADSVTPREHVDVQAASQKWVDSSISKTINVPTQISFKDFQDIYLYAVHKGLKGCTTFRFNPEAHQGVLVREGDLKNTIYRFTLDDGSVMEFKGDEKVMYEGEEHTAANLYDALKEGYFGKY